MANFRILIGAGNPPATPIIRKIGPADLKSVLAKGIEDFVATPSNVVFLSLIYPIVGVLLARMTFGNDLIHLLFPLTAGFALIGPFGAIGLYEMSRRREAGLNTSWKHAFRCAGYSVNPGRRRPCLPPDRDFRLLARGGALAVPLCRLRCAGITDHFHTQLAHDFIRAQTDSRGQRHWLAVRHRRADHLCGGFPFTA